MKTLINPWKGLKLGIASLAPGVQLAGENPNKSLEGIKTSSSTICPSNFEASENPNKSLEGIKTRRGSLPHTSGSW